MEQCKHGSRVKIAEHTGGVYDCMDFRCTACGAFIRMWDIGEINIYHDKKRTEETKSMKI